MSTKMKSVFMVVVITFAGHEASARDFQAGAITIEHPVVRAMLPGADVGGGYLRLTNNGSESEMLIAVSSPRSQSVQFHRMSMANGVMVMREMPGPIEIPAHQSIEFKPSGNHLMFIKAAQRFQLGETIPAIFNFARAGSVTVSFDVANVAGSLEIPEVSEDKAMVGMDMPQIQMGKDEADQTPQIIAAMKAKFETATKPLDVDPVVVQGSWAIVGWSQDGRGGRVLLSRSQTGWMPIICSGESLKETATLQKAGIPAEEAISLTHKLADAENRLDVGRRILLSSFEGSVTIGAPDEVGQMHGNHEGHAQ